MTKKPNYVFDDELYHHGILGQKWGHRRFQNEDGSWTPEGRERYGEGDARSKAKATYETQKYKANLKSKAQKEKDRRAAKEERNRIKEAGKTARVIKKEQAKTDQEGRGKAKFRNTKKMSDEELQSAIDRLKLQSEYNKQYALAKNPDGALAKADRFFSGPTGEAVRAMAVAAMPQAMTALGNLANTALTNKLKYANELDRKKMEADIDKVRAEAEAKRNPVNNKGTKEHDQAIKDRAERMFGNKTKVKENSNVGNKTNEIPRSKELTVSKANNVISSNANSTKYKELTYDKNSPLLKNADPTKTLGDITGWTKEFTVTNTEYKKKLFGKKK